MEPQTKTCQNCKLQFTIEPADLDFYAKIQVPPPTFCWRCRAIRRMAYRNMRHLYARTCDATSEKIFTLIPPDNAMPVYSNKYWNGDQWDAFDYGQDYDFSRPFFEQFKELFNKVPWGIMWSMEMVNSDYSVSAYSRNCYLCFDSGYDEDSAYAVTLLYSKQCFDSLNVNGCELCYYCLNTNQCYKTFFSRNCTSCVETWFSQDCVGCTNIFGCSGLRNKSYSIFNEQYTKEAYEAKLAEMKLDTWSGLQRARRQAEETWRTFPMKFQHGVQVTNSKGDYLYNGTELFTCFFVGTAQNMRYCQSVIYPPNRDGVDVTSSEGTELCYEVIASGGGVKKCLATVECASASDSAYSINCKQINNVFGCVAIRNKSYCILNKQYSKEEYLELLPKIRKHMDEMPYIDAQGRIYKYADFFPFDMSPAGYSQTQAFEYFPVTEEEAKKQGYRWRVPEKRNYAPTKKAGELPDGTAEVDDSILNEVIQCSHEEAGGHVFGCNVDCASAFRITRQELDFYRRMNLPLPRLCFNCRHVDRVTWRNVPALHPRQCMCNYEIYQNQAPHPHHPYGQCPNSFETSYAPDRPEIIYCEKCYQAEVA